MSISIREKRNKYSLIISKCFYSIQLTDLEISRQLGIPISTLRRYKKKYIDNNY